jgi:hypothetical protein
MAYINLFQINAGGNQIKLPVLLTTLTNFQLALKRQQGKDQNL